MTGWNLPPGCTTSDIDRAAGADEECSHQDFEINLERIAACNNCGEKWWAGQYEVDVYCYDRPSFAKELARAERWQRWKFRWWLWIHQPRTQLLTRIGWRRDKEVTHGDDDLPF